MNLDPKPRPDLGGLKGRYKRDGYVIVRQAIGRELAGEARAHVEWLIKRNPGVRPEQFHAERYITLDPGDIVSTGTPAGIGQIKNGDIMRCTIERLGTLCNPVRYR